MRGTPSQLSDVVLLFVALALSVNLLPIPATAPNASFLSSPTRRGAPVLSGAIIQNGSRNFLTTELCTREFPAAGSTNPLNISIYRDISYVVKTGVLPECTSLEI
jgi:hypothetical protein